MNGSLPFRLPSSCTHTTLECQRKMQRGIVLAGAMAYECLVNGCEANQRFKCF
ncbi:hypothetical protein DPMN_185401 [Dreissena polymorpha]|uniref:Uncharacterized protein n=1 Tax=Dreissena polymorpha TaxID=45954 RepID=A0A9D4I794_DREPO|nr:hypothetical protein DPMN_185401 [Dreissena polymorpha]